MCVRLRAGGSERVRARNWRRQRADEPLRRLAVHAARGAAARMALAEELGSRFLEEVHHDTQRNRVVELRANRLGFELELRLLLVQPPRFPCHLWRRPCLRGC